MNSAISSYLPALMLTVIVACSNPTDDPVIDEDLLGVLWKVDTLRTPAEQITPGPDTLMVLQFFDDTRIVADTPCNDYSGTYEINAHGSLAIKWISSTQMACMGRPGTLEGRFIGALNQISVYELSNKTLTLYDSHCLYVVKLNHE